MGQREIPRQPQKGKGRGQGVKGIVGPVPSGYDWNRVKQTGGRMPGRQGKGHR